MITGVRLDHSHVDDGPQTRRVVFQDQNHRVPIDPDLAGRARRNLAAMPWVEVRTACGLSVGLPEADIVYVFAGITQPSPAWLRALRPWGRLLFPLRSLDGLGGMLLVERTETADRWRPRFVYAAGFISCVGMQDEALGERIRSAFLNGGWKDVRSLHWGDSPDGSCWLAGKDWWLSTTS